mgnify:FL=1
MSWLLKSAFLTPTLVGVLEGCRDKVAETDDLRVLTTPQNETIIAISDTIIPRTDTPSASDVRSNYFMDLLLQDVFDKEARNDFLMGLAQFDEECVESTGHSFSKLDGQQRFVYLEKLDKEIMERTYGEHVPFYYLFKELTITIYFSSEKGVTQNLNYTPVPGPYRGEVDFSTDTRIMVGNKL